MRTGSSLREAAQSERSSEEVAVADKNLVALFQRLNESTRESELGCLQVEATGERNGLGSSNDGNEMMNSRSISVASWSTGSWTRLERTRRLRLGQPTRLTT